MLRSSFDTAVEGMLYLTKSFAKWLALKYSTAQKRGLAALLTGTFLTFVGFAGVHFSRATSLVVFFDNFHWTSAYFTMAWLAWIGYRSSPPEWRLPRKCFAITFTAYALGQVVWDVQVAIGWNPFPGPSDFFFVWLGIGCAIGLWSALKQGASRLKLRTVLLDITAASVAVLILTLALYLPRQGNTSPWTMSMLVAYPVAILTAACIGLLMVPILRLRVDLGWVLFLVSLFFHGWLWMRWNSLTLDKALQNGSLFNASFSITAIMSGVGAMCWRAPVLNDRVWERRCEWVLRLLPLLAVLCSATAVVLSFTIPKTPDSTQFTTCAGAIFVSMLAMIRQSFLLQERDRLIEAEEQLIENQANYKTLFDTAQDAIIILQAGVAIDCNSSTLKLLRRAREQIIGRSLTDFSTELQPNGRRSAECARELIAAATAGEPQRFEWTNRTPDGGALQVEVLLSRLERGGEICLQAIVRDVTERKYAETALRDSEERYREIFNTTNEAIYIHNAATGAVLDVNSRAVEMFGASREELLKAEFDVLSEGVTPYSENEAKLWVQRAVREGPQTFEWRSRRADGTLFWTEVSLKHTRISGEPRVLAVVRDIDARKQAEAALRESDERYREIFNATSEGVYIHNEAGEIIELNQRAAEMHGTTREGLMRAIAKEHSEGVPPFSLNEARAWVNRAIHEGPQTFEWRSRRADGTLFWTEISLKHTTISGQPRVLAVVRDIDGRKQAEAQLRKLSRAVECCPVSVIITDPEGRIEYVNPKFTIVTGYAPVDVIGKTPRILKGGETHGDEYNRLWKTITAGQEWHGEFHNRKKNGEYFWESASISPIMDATGKITHYLAVKEDVTQHKAMEDQLRQMQKMEAVGQLSGGIAHDFNNILTVIMGNASLLQSPGLKPAEIHDFTTQITRAGERGASLTRQLLMFARKQKMQPVNLDLNETVANITKMLHRILGEDITLRTEYAPALPRIQADAGMLEQIILNLAVNARDAMAGGGSLVLRTELKEFSGQSRDSGATQVFLHVADTGCGIAPEILPRIFEPFFTTKEVGKGTGLGLATVYGIVQQHRGKITVQSEPGKGTTFSIGFPAGAQAKTSRTAGGLKPALPQGKETILLVEDEQPLRAFVSSLLQRCGYTVLEAGSGPAALKLWERHHDQIALLFTDIIMPDDLNGLELGRRMLAQKPGLKIIHTSGYTDNLEGRKNVSLIEGVNFIRKPYKPEALAWFVRNQLDGKLPAA
jgi:PAS domain S-box-containing protein